MKTQSKSSNVASVVKAGVPKTPEMKNPHAGTSQNHQPSADYSSMWEAIQKIAHPVPFKGLKQFFNM